MNTSDDPLISLREMAELAGVTPDTMRSYRRDGRLPPPDDESVPDRPRWRRSTFDAWKSSRPGRGSRTDLRGPIPITLARYRGVVKPGGRRGDGPWEVACRVAGVEPSIEMLNVQQEPASSDVAEKLGVEAGTPVIRRSRRMLANDTPVQLHTTWMPLHLIEDSRLTEPGIVTGGIYGELTRIGHMPMSVSETLGARMPTKPESQEMRLPPRTPIITVERITRGGDGVVLELLRIASSADRVEITYEDLPLGRPESGSTG
jgi:GntR family transcriptional regulator